MTSQLKAVSRDQNDPAWQARIDLAAAFRWAARLGYNEGICNHFSYALPGSDDRYLINPEGFHFSEIKASDLLLVDGTGKIVEGKHKIEPTAFFIHSRVHKARPSARCVLHTHMPYATALTMVEGGRLEPCLQICLRFYGIVAYDEDDGGYRGLALDNEEGDRMARALGDKRVLFLANHGIIVAGADVHQTFDDLYYLERAAQAQVLAMSTGRKLKLVGGNIARSVQEQVTRDLPVYGRYHFESLKRILDREEPEYKT
jgi:ribulose-5-phosphate 4-epimerase/fuculose-1-phosphate aldolase